VGSSEPTNRTPSLDPPLGCPDTQKFWMWVIDTPTFWQLHIIIQLCLIGLLKHFTVILVYTLCNSVNYIRESSSVWRRWNRVSGSSGHRVSDFRRVGSGRVTD